MPAAGPDFTRRLLADAGIRPGMRVLDAGCGFGEVTFLAAELVGPGGSVVGLDRDEAALAAARERALGHTLPGSPPPTFVRGDLDAPPEALGDFDAVVGRRVLMYQPNAVTCLRALVGRLRPGGIVVFQEHDTTLGPASLTPFPLHDRAQGWLRGMLEREGADPHMGFNLPSSLARAGLTIEGVRAEAIVQTREIAYDLGGIVAACLPRIAAHGVATAEEVGIETLRTRLDAERAATDGVYIGGLMFAAWARKPTMVV